MENKIETFKLSSVPGGDNSTPPCSGTMIGSSMNNSVISEYKQSLASNTNKFQEDTTNLKLLCTITKIRGDLYHKIT